MNIEVHPITHVVSMQAENKAEELQLADLEAKLRNAGIQYFLSRDESGKAGISINALKTQ